MGSPNFIIPEKALLYQINMKHTLKITVFPSKQGHQIKSILVFSLPFSTSAHRYTSWSLWVPSALQSKNCAAAHMPLIYPCLKLDPCPNKMSDKTSPRCGIWNYSTYNQPTSKPWCKRCCQACQVKCADIIIASDLLFNFLGS